MDPAENGQAVFSDRGIESRNGLKRAGLGNYAKEKVGEGKRTGEASQESCMPRLRKKLSHP